MKFADVMLENFTMLCNIDFHQYFMEFCKGLSVMAYWNISEWTNCKFLWLALVEIFVYICRIISIYLNQLYLSLSYIVTYELIN